MESLFEKRGRELYAPLMRWYGFSLWWLAQVVVLGMLIAYQAMCRSAIATMFEFDDVPLLKFFQRYHRELTCGWIVSGCLLMVLVTLVARKLCRNRVWDSIRHFRRRTWRIKIGAGLFIATALFLVLGLFACGYPAVASLAEQESEGANFLMRMSIPVANLIVQGIPPETVTPALKVIEWLLVVLAPVVSWFVAQIVSRVGECRPKTEIRLRPPRTGLPVRLGAAYLIGCAAVVIYAVLEHKDFWNYEKTRYNFRPFFQDDEIAMADMVLYSTSMLFASIAAWAGCVGLMVLHWLSRAGRRAGLAMTITDCRRQAWLLGALWAGVTGVPWQMKILLEIQAERGWILPAVILFFTTAALTPVLLASCLMMKRDFDEVCARVHQLDPDAAAQVYPRRSEFALWALLFFPVYPLLRVFRIGGGRPQRARAVMHHLVLMLLTGGLICGLMWAVNTVDAWYDFDDWRGMMEKAQFPFLQVFASLLAGCAVYLSVRTLYGWGFDLVRWPRWRVLRWTTLSGAWSARILAVAAALACCVAATWPFWGWNDVSKNVFARTYEYSDRHEFEILFLHWLFDYDRDGYAAVLHGADADDFDSGIGAGGIPAPEVVPLHIDEFSLTDRAKADRFPNLVIFYLEGIVPRTLSSWPVPPGPRVHGDGRWLPGGLKATPYIDSVAAEGTFFTQARCFYPSTWDVWATVNSGRYFRVKELDNSVSFGNRYSRYNNLYKILQQVGIDRWCHANQAPYSELFTPEHMQENEATDWQPDFDYQKDCDNDDLDIWHGDNRARRMVDFLDDLEPDDRFFMCEHMSDTHFEWHRTSLERAKELGFPNGLEPYEADAVLPDGRKDDRYSRYFQTITRVDAQVGLVLNKLKERGFYDNTIIVFVGDHGCQWWEHEHTYYVGHLYEQSIHIPMIVKIPGIKGPVVSDEPVVQMDLFATFMELAGARHDNPRDDYPMTCRSLLPLMKKEATPEQVAGYRNRDMVLMTHYDTLGVIAKNFRYKLIFDRPSGTYWLFDLEERAPGRIYGEMTNLADDEPELLEEMLERLRFLLDRHKTLVGEIAREE